jgi:hypothetical protein
LAYPVQRQGGLFPVSVSGEGEDAADEAVGHEADRDEGRKDEPEDDFYSEKATCLVQWAFQVFHSGQIIKIK